MDLGGPDILTLLEYGFVGVGVILTLMSYSLLRKSLAKEKPSSQVLKLITLFLTFTALLIIFDITYRVIDSMRYTNPVTVAVDPTNPDIWNKPKDLELCYNAPYALASDEFITENINEIKEHNVHSQFLLFEGNTDDGFEDFKKKFSRMRSLVIKMSKVADLSNYIEVRIARNKRVPEISFFNPTKKNGDDAVIYYLKDLILENGKPQVAFQTDNLIMVKYFNKRFVQDFENAEVIDMGKLCNPKYRDSEFY